MVQQKRNLAKCKRKIFLRKSCQISFTKQRSDKRKVKKSIQKLVKRVQRKRYQQLIQCKKEALQNK